MFMHECSKECLEHLCLNEILMVTVGGGGGRKQGLGESDTSNGDSTTEDASP